MRLLLDTHAFLWFLAGDPKMSTSAKAAIEDSANQSIVSVASLWEIAIKVSLRKLAIGEPFDTLIPRQIRQNGFGLLPIGVNHVAALASLPFHHRDPFDRMLVAQAGAEKMTLISRDEALDAYGITRLW